MIIKLSDLSINYSSEDPDEEDRELSGSGCWNLEAKLLANLLNPNLKVVVIF